MRTEYNQNMCRQASYFKIEANITFFSYRDVDQVHDMMEDIAEQQDVAKEISDAISNPVAFGKYYFICSLVHCFLFFIMTSSDYPVVYVLS